MCVSWPMRLYRLENEGSSNADIMFPTRCLRQVVPVSYIHQRSMTVLCSFAFLSNITSILSQPLSPRQLTPPQMRTTSWQICRSACGPYQRITLEGLLWPSPYMLCQKQYFQTDALFNKRQYPLSKNGEKGISAVPKPAKRNSKCYQLWKL